MKAINSKFSSFGKFKEEFTNKDLALFGSGWTWLVLDNGKLEIINLPNQDCPVSQGKKSLMAVDMWEHSFYLKHRANKQAYLEDFFHVINWDKVNEFFIASKS